MKVLSKRDSSYILSWSKKIKAINLLGGKCSKCGNDNVFVLEFHHLDKKDKLFSINNIKNCRWSILEKEIKKCSLLCSNCHSELNCSNDSRNSQNKIKILNSIILSNIKCLKCGYRGENLASLDFHHKSNKKFIINNAIYRKIKISIIDLIKEINKCDILCRNCHRIIHSNIDKFNSLKKNIYSKITNYIEPTFPLDPEIVWDMCINGGARQITVADFFGVSKGTISCIIKRYAIKNDLKIPNKILVYKEGKKINIIRESKQNKFICLKCKKEFFSFISYRKFCCKKCASFYRRKSDRPTLEQLKEMLKTMSYANIAKKYGVSRHAVYFWVNPRSSIH